MSGRSSSGIGAAEGISDARAKSSRAVIDKTAAGGALIGDATVFSVGGARP
jgi:hypothetical protein